MSILQSILGSVFAAPAHRRFCLFSQGIPDESLDKMSLVRLRQLVLEIPGATRTKRDSDGKHKEKTKAQLIATIRELSVVRLCEMVSMIPGASRY